MELHDLVPAGPEVRGRDRGDPAQHDRRARARPAAGAAAGQGDPVQRAARQGAGGHRIMNLALSDEQEFLRDAARGALARHKTIEAARDAADGGELPDLWPVAVEAGWPGLLVSENNGGAGLQPFDAMLVAQECGRVLAGVALLGHVPASYLLDRGGYSRIGEVADGSLRAAFCPARPPGDVVTEWTVDARRGLARGAPPSISGDSATGEVPWVPDAPGAGVFVVVGVQDGEPVALAVEGGSVEDVSRYDRTRSLGHVTFDGAAGERLDVSAEQIA